MLLSELPHPNVSYSSKYKDYFLNIHQQILDSIPSANVEEHAAMHDIAAAWGSCRAYKHILDAGDNARIMRVEQAIRLNLQMEKILNYGDVASMDEMQRILFPQRVAILNALQFNTSPNGINPLADVPFSYWQRARLRAAFLGASLPRIMSGSLFGFRSQRDAFAKQLPAFPDDDKQMTIKEHHLRNGNVLLEYLSIQSPGVQQDDRRLLIRMEGRNVHYAQRTHHYAQDYKRMNEHAGDKVIDMIVLNHANVSTSANRAAKNIDELASGVEAVIASCIHQGYKAENITLLGTCAGSQVTSYVVAKNIRKYPIKCISDRSFSSFEQVVRGHIEHIRLAVRPSSNRPLWQYIPLRILWFPLWGVAECVTRSLYAMVRCYLWFSGWKLQQAAHINTIPLHRLQVFQAKAYSTSFQLDDKVLPHAHIAQTLEERRLDVLAYLDKASSKDKNNILLQRVSGFIKNSYKVYTEGRNSKGKPHDPHVSPLHHLFTHDKQQPLLHHMAQFILPSTKALDEVVKGLPPANHMPRSEAIHPLLLLLFVGIAYGILHTTMPYLIAPDMLKIAVILVGSYFAYDLCYSYIEECSSYFQGERQVTTDYTMVQADAIRFAAPLLVNMEKPEQEKFAEIVGVASAKKS